MTNPKKTTGDLNLGDSLGLLAIILAIFTFVTDPSPTTKFVLLMGACICSAVFVWISHWTYKWTSAIKFIAVLFAIAFLWADNLAKVAGQVPALQGFIATGSRLRATAHTEQARLASAALIGGLVTLVGLTVLGVVVMRVKELEKKSAANKGFLDFKLQAEQATAEFPSRMAPISDLVADVGKLVEAQTIKTSALLDSGTANQLKSIRDLAKRLNAYTKKLEAACDKLEATTYRYAEGLTGWTEWMETLPGCGPEKQQIVDLTQKFGGSTLEAARHTNDYLNLLISMRGVSQDLNHALDQHISQVIRIKNTLMAVADSSISAAGRLLPKPSPGPAPSAPSLDRT